MDICRDLADGHLDGTYSQADLAAYQDALAHDPTIQGYCSPLVVVTPPPNAPAAPPAAPTPPPAAPAKPAVVAAATNTKTAPTAPTTGVAGASKTKTAPPPSSAAPLASTRTGGTLPFTGLQLGIFVVVGVALLCGGLLLRLSARNRKPTP